MRSPDQHLSADEMELLGNEERLSGEVGDRLGPAREHAESCPACRRRLEVYPSSRAKLAKLRAPQRVPKGPDCPPIEIWLNLAGGLLTTGEQERYTAHAAQCDSCGSVLREVVGDFSEPITEEEKTILPSLQVDNQRWRWALTQSTSNANSETFRMLQPATLHRRWFALPGWQAVAASLLICAGITFGLLKFGTFGSKDTVASVNQLLAKAYTDQRSVELRIPGAAYGPMRVERGGEASHVGRPPSLLEAEAAMARDVSKQHSPLWLQARARAHLLEWEYGDALKDLDEALTTKPDLPSLLVDKATALFERAETLGQDSSLDYSEAIELLGRTLKTNPDDAVALFNRAIIYEKEQLPDQAIQDWEHYLRVDHSGAWSKEASRRLGELRKRIKDHDGALSQPLFDAPAFVQVISSHDANAIDHIDQRIEDYQDLALRSWLPSAYEAYSGVTAQKIKTIAALKLLAQLIATRHRDRWLEEMLNTSSSSTWYSALSKLSQALQEDTDGNIEKATQDASASLRLFLAAGSRAGAFRAELQMIYDLHRASDGKKCLRLASHLSEKLHTATYGWIKAQLLLERAVAFNLVGQIGEAQRYAEEGLRLAGTFGYHDLRLRALGLVASLSMQAGDLSEAWLLDRQGLEQYWNSTVSPLRAHQFYTDLSFSAENLSFSNLAYALSKEALEATSHTGDPARECVARFLLGKAAITAGFSEEGENEFRHSDQLLNLLPSTRASKLRKLYNQLELAKLQTKTVSPKVGLALFAKIEPDLIQFGSIPLLRELYQGMGDAYVQNANFISAKTAYHLAIAAAESNICSLTNARDRLAWQKETDESYKGLIRIELTDRHSNEALGLWEWHRASAFNHCISPSETAWAKNVSKLIQVETGFLLNTRKQLNRVTVLSYIVFADGLGIWIYDDQGIVNRFVRLPPGQLQAVAARFYQQCSDPGSDLSSLKETARQLYNWLVNPIEAQLKSDRILIIEPDEILKEIPFQALVDSNRNYFGDIHLMEMLPSIGYYDHLRAVKPITSHSPALIVNSAGAVVDSLATLPALSDAERETGAVADHFQSPVRLSGNTATREAIFHELSGAVVFHFAGHAISVPGRTRLVLSGNNGNGSYLDATLLRNLRTTKLELVVLSGCGTGKPAEYLLPDLDSLAEVFLGAGVPNVVASRWNLDSATAADFMGTFYVQLLADRSVPEAIETAASSIRSSESKKHPYFWAAFDAYGISNK